MTKRTGWHDRVAIVTGGSRGIGKAVIEKVISEGGRAATVACHDAGFEAMKRLGVLTLRGDLVKDSAASELVARTLSSFGRLDALVNCVGRGEPTAWDAPDANWLDMFDVNLFSAIRMCRAAVPALRRSSSPRIVNVASELVYMPDQDLVAYTAAKAALMSFSKSLAAALASDGVLVNVVSPGTVATAGVLDHYERLSGCASTTTPDRIEGVH